MWELDYKESWMLKNWCFWTVVLEKTLESPLDSKEIQPAHPKGDQSWLFIGRTDAEAEAPILWLPDGKSWLIWKDPDAGKDWGREEKGMTEDETAGWHHWLDGHEFGWTPGVGDGQGGLACCYSWGHKEQHDWVTEKQQGIVSLTASLPPGAQAPVCFSHIPLFLHIHMHTLTHTRAYIYTWYLLLFIHVHMETAWPLLLKHHHLCHIYWRIAMLMATLPIIPLTFIATLWGRVYYSPLFIGDKTEVHKDEATLPTSHWEVQRRLWTALSLEATLCSKTTPHLPSQPERERSLWKVHGALMTCSRSRRGSEKPIPVVLGWNTSVMGRVW